MEVGHTRNRLARTAGLMVAGLTVLACALSPASSPTPSAPPTQSPAISPTASPSATATPTPSPTVTATPAPEAAISAGLVHSCALVDGRVLCWGSNQMGEVGQGPTIGAVWYGPVEVAGLWGVTAISAGGSAHPFDSRPSGGHSCALRAAAPGAGAETTTASWATARMWTSTAACRPHRQQPALARSQSR